ncbi:MAG: hypothetical protein NZ524_11235 [Thiobacillaceae bacterium]|nr:hypothetical protein [Thiobacillaceae bacterium]MDW8322840.1 hypothetical protein [Burkholderiales bacterium]
MKRSGLRQLLALLATARFWYTFLGVTLALLLWAFLFHQSVKVLDTSLTMHSAFCASHEERNRHILVLVLTIPLFLVGLIGVIGEWIQFVENRAKGRRTPIKSLIAFFVLMQATAAVILLALQC